jgi:hypothetical protein
VPETNEAVHRLTEVWEDVLSPKETGLDSYRTIEYEPLLDMLREAIGSSTGRTSAGRSDANARNVLNVKAFDLWQRIDGATRAWIGELSRSKPFTELKAAVVQLDGIVNSLNASHQIDPFTYARITAMFESWKDDIWDQFFTQRQMEIMTPCPYCGETFTYAQDGARSYAVTAEFAAGVAIATCARCKHEWNGREELLELGYSVGANMDRETLKAMGVIA